MNRVSLIFASQDSEYDGEETFSFTQITVPMGYFADRALCGWHRKYTKAIGSCRVGLDII